MNQSTNAAPIKCVEPKLTVIKMTAASILRESHIIDKLSHQTTQMLNEYEINLRDATEYEARKATMQILDEVNQSKQIELHRELAKISLEEARIAVASHIENNQFAASQVRLRSEEILQQKQVDRENDCKQKRIVSSEDTSSEDRR